MPKSWYLSSAAVADLAAAQSEEEWKALLASAAAQMSCPVAQRSVQGAVRYCEKCQCVKPDRSHHCSVCETCTLKMDHHCPWVNNCVGFANYKVSGRESITWIRVHPGPEHYILFDRCSAFSTVQMFIWSYWMIVFTPPGRCMF